MITNFLKKHYLMFADLLSINAAFILSTLLHYEGSFPNNFISNFATALLIQTIIKLMVFKYYQLYDSFWQYASIEELVKVVTAVLAGNVVGFIYWFSIGKSVKLGILVFALLLEVSFIGSARFGSRIIQRLSRQQSLTRNTRVMNYLIIGSGATASLIATEIKNHPQDHGKIVGFIDDDPKLKNKTISGIKVLGDKYDIETLVRKHNVKEIIIAIPNANTKEMKEILEECKRTTAKTVIMPGVREVLNGQISLSKIRNVEIDDLLQKEPFDLDVIKITEYISEKTIMVTGAGGMIGSELCRQLLGFSPKKLILLDIYENTIYTLQNELMKDYPDVALDLIVGTTQDRGSIFKHIETLAPDVIFHAATYNNEAFMERSPLEAIRNNTFGTRNIAEAASTFGVKHFILVSTDKVVNATSILNASHRMSEIAVQCLSKKSPSTIFSIVRFGNVLGSKGSVIPIFKRQIKEGGPVTVTHKEVVRYFISLPEVSQLLIQAGSIAQNGQILHIDMGKSVRIYDLAKDLITLSGLKPFKDIDIQIIGLRPGEKLFEQRLLKPVHTINTQHEKIHEIEPMDLDYTHMLDLLNELQHSLAVKNDENVFLIVKQLIHGYSDYTALDSIKIGV